MSSHEITIEMMPQGMAVTIQEALLEEPAETRSDLVRFICDAIWPEGEHELDALRDQVRTLKEKSTAGWAPTHQHRKGSLYRVIVRGHMEADYPASPVVVYDDAEGRVFVRPADEFDDGRFTEVRHG